MGRARFWPMMVLLAAAVTFVTAVSSGEPVPPPAACPANWTGNEQLTFNVSWVGAKAGTVVVTAQQSDGYAGPGQLRVRVKADTSKFFSRFFRVRDQFESCFVQEDCRAMMFRKKIREGRYRKVERTTFDHGQGTFERLIGKLFFQKTLTGTIPTGTKDPISSLYYMRTRALTAGDKLEFDTHTDGKNYRMIVSVEPGKLVKTPAGSWNTVRLVPMPTFEGRVFRKGESSLIIWLATAEPRLPVLIEADVPIGTLRAELAAVSYGPAVPQVEEFEEEDRADGED